MIKGIFHININVTDFDRSLLFYKLFGFQEIFGMEEAGSPNLSTGLRIPNAVCRMALLKLGDDPRAARLDLIEWKHPRTQGTPYPHLYHTGIARLCLWTKNLDEDYERLKAAGVPFFSEPQPINLKGGECFVCCTDPDGTVLELIEFL